MSTMRVTNLKHENSASNNIVLNSDGSVGGELATTLASKLDLAGGKILQIVRATDATGRSTTSSTFVDVTGMSVTITPQKSDSAIIVMCAFYHSAAWTTATNQQSNYRITDASNNPISGAQNVLMNVANISGTGTRTFYAYLTLIGYSTPASTSAQTYKLQFSSPFTSDVTTTVGNNATTGQMYAIEVSA